MAFSKKLKTYGLAARYTKRACCDPKGLGAPTLGPVLFWSDNHIGTKPLIALEKCALHSMAIRQSAAQAVRLQRMDFCDRVDRAARAADKRGARKVR